MQSLTVILLATLAAITSSSPTPNQQFSPRNKFPAPGPIPYPNPAQGYPNQQSVTIKNKHSGLRVSKADMLACLEDYGRDRFYDSWDGNYCGGFGWFKGSSNGEIGTYECYETCATYIEGQGFGSGSTDFQCDFQTGAHGHCWMGYHPASPPKIKGPYAVVPRR